MASTTEGFGGPNESDVQATLRSPLGLAQVGA
jgi:hypothetical protein